MLKYERVMGIQNGGFPSMRNPLDRWMVDFVENPKITWMI
jgi:hypothetical protein